MLHEYKTNIDMSLIFDAIYPVGSIYMSVNNTSPEVLFGGTWIQIQDTFLLACGDTYTAGDAGGSATHTPDGTLSGGAVGDHTLSIDEMPGHRHWISGAAYDDGNMSTSGSNSQDFGLAGDAGSYTSYDQCKANGRYGAYGGGSNGIDGKGSSAGTTTAHNHPFTQPTFIGEEQDTMPPYLAVYCWKRTA